jgi:hypothetical protein
MPVLVGVQDRRHEGLRIVDADVVGELLGVLARVRKTYLSVAGARTARLRPGVSSSRNRAAAV